MSKKRKIRRIFYFLIAVILATSLVVAIRSYGLYEQKQLQAKREAEIVKFWSDYKDAKDGNNEVAKSIKNDFIERMSKEMSIEELLELINKTLEDPITLEELIEE